MRKPKLRCRMFGHKWRAYYLAFPVFHLRCTRCQANSRQRIPEELIRR